MFCNFYFVKNYKTPNNSTTVKAREKINTDLKSLEFFDKMSHRFQVTTKLFTLWNIPITLKLHRLVQFWKCLCWIESSLTKFMAHSSSLIKVCLLYCKIWFRFWEAKNTLFFKPANLEQILPWWVNWALCYIYNKAKFALSNGKESTVNRTLGRSTYPG